MEDRKKPLILIVDDNPRNLQYLGNLLRDNGYDPAAATNGRQAFAFLAKRRPDLILLDIMMPGMDGYSVCAKVKANKATHHIPIIFLSAKTEPEDIARGFECGGVDYVTKPFHAVELLARVKTHVEMKILRGFLPICASCKKVREDKGYWMDIEEYLKKHADILLSHSLCKECADKLYGDDQWYRDMEAGEHND